MRELVRVLLPVIRTRALRVLMRYRRRPTCIVPRHELDDMVQEIWAALLANGARNLRHWEPSRGLGLAGYVGLAAERDAISILRARRQVLYGQQSAEDEDEFAGQPSTTPSPEDAYASREILLQLMNTLRREFTAKGAAIFELSIVEEQPLSHVCAVMNMTPEAVYAWRSRLARRARTLYSKLSAETQSTRNC